jgi:hypothetical protein
MCWDDLLDHVGTICAIVTSCAVVAICAVLTFGAAVAVRAV